MYVLSQYSFMSGTSRLIEQPIGVARANGVYGLFAREQAPGEGEKNIHCVPTKI